MSRTAIILTVLLLLVIVVPATAVMYVNNRLPDPAYCASCHQDPHYISWADPQTAYSLAHVHQSHHVDCQDCHARTLQDALAERVKSVTGDYPNPIPQARLANRTCFRCHGNYEVLAARTQGLERNPHAGHWGKLECGVCHDMHRDSSNFCDNCHAPVNKGAPGWIFRPLVNEAE